MPRGLSELSCFSVYRSSYRSILPLRYDRLGDGIGKCGWSKILVSMFERCDTDNPWKSPSQCAISQNIVPHEQGYILNKFHHKLILEVCLYYGNIWIEERWRFRYRSLFSRALLGLDNKKLKSNLVSFNAEDTVECVSHLFLIEPRRRSHEEAWTAFITSFFSVLWHAIV